MTTESLLIELPDHVVRALKELAVQTHQTPEKLAALSVVGNLPPRLPEVSTISQAEFLALQNLSVDELRQIASSQWPQAQHERQGELLEKNAEGTISAAERHELVQLREDADRHMLRKAYAWAVLRWRGYPTPSLDELPLE